MESQRHLFHLPPELHYINCAYMSPLLRTAEIAGIEGIKRKRNPALLQSNHFFNEIDPVRNKFGQLINADPQRVAIAPSASYGLMSAIQNVPYQKGNHVICVADKFPSGYYAAQRWCTEHGAELRFIDAKQGKDRTADWNTKILEAISKDTAFVLMEQIHWMDGTVFDLAKIGQRCRETNSYLIVDGSQSVGAYPMDVEAFQIDALIVAAYKWMLGPYSLGLGYFGNRFDDGQPIEESWMNRNYSRDFSQLANYDSTYRDKAQRYNVGETTNLIHIPMIEAGLDQILNWSIDRIQNYCRWVTTELISELRQLGFELARDDERAFHLFSLKFPEGIAVIKFLDILKLNNIILSIRGDSIRITPHIYNTKDEMDKLLSLVNEYIRNQ